MMVEYIRYRITGDADEFERAYERAQDSLRRSEHCLAWELSRCVPEPSCYMLRIEWASAEAHMQGFRGSAEFKDFLSHVRPYVDQIEEMRHYEPTAATSVPTPT